MKWFGFTKQRPAKPIACALFRFRVDECADDRTFTMRVRSVTGETAALEFSEDDALTVYEWLKEKLGDSAQKSN
jgi:hypothetical protein